jgi:FAD-dependent oxidoreductase domain-containing protein 1
LIAADGTLNPTFTITLSHTLLLGRIAVIERDKTYQSCSAMLSAGGIRQQFSLPENIKMSMYGAQFIKNMEQLEVDGEIPDVQFHESGYLYLAGTKAQHILEENNRIQRTCGVDWIDLYTPKQLSKLNA